MTYKVKSAEENWNFSRPEFASDHLQYIRLAYQYCPPQLKGPYDCLHLRMLADRTNRCRIELSWKVKG